LSPASDARSAARVKIAILDTGCDISNVFFRANGINQVDELKRNWHDCLEESVEEPTDEDAGNHGTALAILLLLLAPGAEIHIIRVSRDWDGFDSAKNAIAKVCLLVVMITDVYTLLTRIRRFFLRRKEASISYPCRLASTVTL
jgi:hypothetical protein